MRLIMWTWNYDRRKQRKWLKEWELITIISAFRMATLKEPPEASYKPPPKSKWSVPPAAPKCPACRKGSDNNRLYENYIFKSSPKVTLLSEHLPPKDLNLSCWASDGFRQDSIPQGLRPLQTLQGSQPGDKGVHYKFRFCCQIIFMFCCFILTPVWNQKSLTPSTLTEHKAQLYCQGCYQQVFMEKVQKLISLSLINTISRLLGLQAVQQRQVLWSEARVWPGQPGEGGPGGRDEGQGQVLPRMWGPGVACGRDQCRGGQISPGAAHGSLVSVTYYVSGMRGLQWVWTGSWGGHCHGPGTKGQVGIQRISANPLWTNQSLLVQVPEGVRW